MDKGIMEYELSGKVALCLCEMLRIKEGLAHYRPCLKSFGQGEVG
jgi:hypothetical protein